MLTNWLRYNARISCSYTKFSVTDIIEVTPLDLSKPNNEIVTYLGQTLLFAHGNPQMIADDCAELLQDTEKLGLNVIKKYVEEEILPSKKMLITRIGNFGEILASQCLVEFEKYSFPVYKLRFREKRSWAMRLTDLFLVKTSSVPDPVICYGEVKTRSTKTFDRHVAKEAHDSLKKDDALTDPQILKFTRTILYEKGMLEEARFFQKVQLNKIRYDINHVLFLVHEATTWDEQILGELEDVEVDPRLTNLNVVILHIGELRRIIDLVYDNAWKGVEV